MQFSDCSCEDFEIYIFWEKCKQTAEISWLFFSEVKNSKYLIKDSFGKFCADV